MSVKMTDYELPYINIFDDWRPVGYSEAAGVLGEVGGDYGVGSWHTQVPD